MESSLSGHQRRELLAAAARIEVDDLLGEFHRPLDDLQQHLGDLLQWRNTGGERKADGVEPDEHEGTWPGAAEQTV